MARDHSGDYRRIRRFAWHLVSQIQVVQGLQKPGIHAVRSMTWPPLWKRLGQQLMGVKTGGDRKRRVTTFAVWSATWFADGERRRGWKPRTVLVYRNVLRHLNEAFGPMRLDEMRPRHISHYARQALEGGLSPNYVNLHLRVLHHVLKTAVAEEVFAGPNPVVGVERGRVPRRRWRILEPAEVARVRAAFSEPQARTIFITIMLTGLRRFELEALRWRDIDLVEGTLRVVESKSEAGERLIALPAPLIDELDAHRKRSVFRGDEHLVFCHPTLGSRMPQKWFSRELSAALAAAGISDHIRPFHDLRHAALTNLAATGASPIAVMATAGHRSMSTTAHYLHLAGIVFRPEADALAQRLLGTGEQRRRLPLGPADLNPSHKEPPDADHSMIILGAH
jgi:integrase